MTGPQWLLSSALLIFVSLMLYMDDSTFIFHFHSFLCNKSKTRITPAVAQADSGMEMLQGLLEAGHGRGGPWANPLRRGRWN